MNKGYEELLKKLKDINSRDSFSISLNGKRIQLTIDKIEEDTKKDTTIVTALWNLGRNELSKDFRRSYDHYKEKFIELLKSPSNMFIYVSQEDEEFIWEHRDRENTHVRIMELSEFDSWFEFFDLVQTIRQNPSWFEQAGWLTQSPQAKLKYYNPLVMSKMFLLNNATFFNPFDSEYFYWIDAGITNTVHPGYFYKDRVFDNLSTYSKAVDGFIFLSYPYEEGNEIHGFPREKLEKYCNTSHIKYVCRGGFFGGEKSIINQLNSIYHTFLADSLKNGYMGTEESIFTIIAHRYPEYVNRFQIGSDGLIWPFFEELKNVEDLIRNTPKKPITLNTAKNIIYILGFNSPKQFDSICKSINSADVNFFDKSRKILINNSTDESTFQEYDEICELYGFEEIHRENLGVCGGRQFAAEHFETSNADFYMFFEDDMHLNDKNTEQETCRNGFKKYIPNFYEKIVKIMIKENFDFLKFSFSEFYGDNSVQWAWYNVPQNIRTEFWPNYDKLPEFGTDPNTPKTKFDRINVVDELPYIDGEVYYSNWPQIVNREGNKKMFIDTKWDRPYEQTWMSHIFQMTKKGEIKSAVLLASPVNHNRFEHYDGTLRKES